MKRNFSMKDMRDIDENYSAIPAFSLPFAGSGWITFRGRTRLDLPGGSAAATGSV
jgi:hypothetical protein